MSAERSWDPLLEGAVRLASRGHYFQFRKGAGGDRAEGPPLDPEAVPYVSHLIGVALILARHGASAELLAAALLHDYLEDVGAAHHEEILAACGPEALELVASVTETKRNEKGCWHPWEVRKAEIFAHLEDPQASADEAVLLKLADCLHNASSLLFDLAGADDEASVWARFSASPARTVWYYRRAAEIGARRLPGHPLVAELEAVACELDEVLP